MLLNLHWWSKALTCNKYNDCKLTVRQKMRLCLQCNHNNVGLRAHRHTNENTSRLCVFTENYSRGSTLTGTTVTKILKRYQLNIIRSSKITPLSPADHWCTFLFQKNPSSGRCIKSNKILPENTWQKKA